MVVDSLSQKIGTCFPYDWANPSGMEEDVFVRLVFEKGLFRDILQTVRYFGVERVESIYKEMEAGLPRLTRFAYSNIKTGYENAQNRRAS